MKKGSAPGLEPLGLAAMYSEALLIKQDARGIVLSGSIFAADLGDVSAHVKITSGDGRRLYAECLSSALAQAIGLSVPRPYLVMVHPSACPDSLNEPTWGFGSTTQHPAIAAPLQGHDEETYAVIRRWARFHALCVFDEWIANHDRSPEHLFYDGRDFTLIDHGEALPETLAARQRATGGNHQLDRAALLLSEFERHAALRKLKDAGAAIPTLPLHQAKNVLHTQWTQNGLLSWTA